MVLYLEKLARDGRPAEVAKVLRYVDLLEEHGADLPRLSERYARIIDRDEQIYELRPQPHRVAYFEHSGIFILLHAWRKQSQKLSRTALRRARRAAAEWRDHHR